jgi:hypothetical protein
MTFAFQFPQRTNTPVPLGGRRGHAPALQRVRSVNYRAPLKTPFCVLGGSFASTFAYKNLERHPVFLRFLTQNLKQNPSPNPSNISF